MSERRPRKPRPYDDALGLSITPIQDDWGIRFAAIWPGGTCDLDAVTARKLSAWLDKFIAWAEAKEPSHD